MTTGQEEIANEDAVITDDTTTTDNNNNNNNTSSTGGGGGTNLSDNHGNPKVRMNKAGFRLALDNVTSNNMNQLRRLNSVLFPIRYKDSFYRDALAVGEYCKMAYFNDVPVGGLICRKEAKNLDKNGNTPGGTNNNNIIDNNNNNNNYVQQEQRDAAITTAPSGGGGGGGDNNDDGHGNMGIYLMTLGVLAPYRQLGLGSMMVKHVKEIATKDGMDYIYVHVQVSNSDARRFYERLGFVVEETIENYYKHNVEVKDAWLLKYMIPK